MPQKLQNITNTDCLINENRTDFEKTREILRSYPISLTECARMMCSFLFAAFFSCLQRSCYLQHTSLNCSSRFLFAAYFFICSVSFLFAAFLFCLQRFFLVCSVSFLFAAFLFCLQRFFFVCSMSLVGHRSTNTDIQAQFQCVYTKYNLNETVKPKLNKNFSFARRESEWKPSNSLCQEEKLRALIPPM